MPFDKNSASKAGKKSSRKGSPNKTNEEIRERFKDLLDDNLERIQEDLDKLEPEERLKIILNLSKFVLPTLKSTEIIPGEDQKVITIDFTE